MAWPPPVLPTNRTNATPQNNNHPGDHNAANHAINDIVPVLADAIAVPNEFTSITGTGGVVPPTGAIFATRNIAAHPKPRIALVTIQLAFSVTAAGDYVDVLLTRAGAARRVVRIPTTLGWHTATDTLIDSIAPATAATYDLRIQDPRLAGINVLADPRFNNITVMTMRGLDVS